MELIELVDARRALQRARVCIRHGTLFAKGPQSEFYRVIRDLSSVQSTDDEVQADISSAIRAVQRHVAPQYDPALVDDAWIQRELTIVPRQIVPTRGTR